MDTTSDSVNWAAEIVLKVQAGEPGERFLQISPAYVGELSGMLEAQGFHPSLTINKSITDGPLLYLLALPVSGATVHALASTVRAFLARHKDKEIVFGTKGQIKSIKGYSESDVAKLVQMVTDAVERRQLKQDEHDGNA